MLEGQTITPAAMLALLPLTNRADIEATIEWLIAELDLRDGDIDMEDSEAGDSLVDERGRRLDYHTLADHFPDCGDSEDGDRAWQEWTARDTRTRRRAVHEPIGSHTGQEDDEDDDADEDDGADMCSAGDDGCGLHIAGQGPTWGSRDAEPEARDVAWIEHHERQPDVMQAGGDSEDAEDDDRRGRMGHTRRIRRTRCFPTNRPYDPYRLRDQRGLRVIKGGLA